MPLPKNGIYVGSKKIGKNVRWRRKLNGTDVLGGVQNHSLEPLLHK